MFLLINSFPLFSQTTSEKNNPVKKFSIGLQLVPELSWYKPKSAGLVRPGISSWFGLSLGWGAITQSFNYGIRSTYNINSKISIGSGFFMSKNGSTIQFNNPTSYNYSQQNGFTNVNQIDSTKLQINQESYQLNKRKYICNYFLAPIFFRYKMPKIELLNRLRRIKIESDLHISIGAKLYYLNKALANDIGALYYSSDSSLHSANADGLNITNDMNRTMIALSFALDREVHFDNNFFILFGWQFIRGLTNPAKNQSNYNLDAQKSIDSFRKGGSVVPLTQIYHMNSLSFNLSLGYSF